MYCEQCHITYPEGRKFCPQCGAFLTAQAPEDKVLLCPSCEKEVPPGRKFCIFCGSSITAGPRSCHSCGAFVPPEAKFCGDCGTPLLTRGTAPLGSVRTSELDATERTEEGNTELAREEMQATQRVSSGFSASGHKAEWKDTLFRWLHRPWLRISIEISLLTVVALFSYQLGSRLPTKVGDEPTQVSPVLPSPDPTSEGQPRPPTDVGTQEEGWTVAPPDSEGKVNKATQAPPAPAEQPLSSPRFYRVTTPTVLRDKPTWTGKEVAQLKPDTKIQVVAIAGDWLKVESKSNPPKPPGYVWKEDARPE